MIEISFKLTLDVEAGVKKLGAGVMAVLLLMVAASCGESSDSRDRNARSIAGSSCKKAGQTKTVGKVLHVCGIDGTSRRWFAAVSPKPKGAACRKAGVVKKATAKSSVCGTVGKKQFWIPVRPLPASMIAPATSPLGEAAVAGTTIVDGSTSTGATSTTIPSTTTPTTIVVPNDEFKKAVAALSVPARSVLTTSFTSATSGTAVSPAPVLQLVDEGGNPRGRAGVIVNVVVDNEDVVVSGGRSVTDDDGRAAFDQLTFTGAAGPMIVTFEPEALASVSVRVELVPGAPSEMLLMTGTTSLVAGAQWEPAPSVALVDSAGNFAGREGDEIVARVKDGSVLGKATIGKDNFAHFTLTASQAAGSWEVEFVGPDGIEPESTTMTIVPAAADRIVVDTVLPAMVTNGTAVSEVVAVHVADQYGNLVKDAGTKIVMAISPYVNARQDGVGAYVPKGEVLNSEATIDKSGEARFIAPTVEAEAGDWVLTFAADSKDFAQAFHEVTVVPGIPVALEIVTPPAGARSGLPLVMPPALRFVDKSGNAIHVKGYTITASVPVGYDVSKGSAITDDEGVATFKGLTISGRSQRVAMSFNSPLMPTLVKEIYLAPGAIAKLVVVDHAKTAVAGETFTTTSKIGIADVSGNVVDERVSVLGQCDGSRNWFGSQTINGVASFSDFVVNRAGSATCKYTYFTGEKLLSLEVVVSVSSADATTIEILTQPPTSAVMGGTLSATPRARLVDSYGNNVEKAGVTVGIYTTNPSLIIANGVVKTDASGIADFSALSFGGYVGTYRLSIAPVGGIAVAAAADTVITAGTASRAVVETQLAGLASGVKASTQPTLKITDAWTNPVPSGGWVASLLLTPTSLEQQATKLLSISGNSATSGTDGRVKFSNVVASGLSGVTYVPTYSVSRDGKNLPLVTGTSVALAPGMATQFEAEISESVASGGAIGTIEQRDSKGNLVSDAGAKSAVVSYQKVSGSSWGRQVNADVTTNGRTTIGYRIFGTQGAAGTLSIDVGDQTPLTFDMSLTTSAVVGDPAPAGGILISVPTPSRNVYYEVAPFKWASSPLYEIGSYEWVSNYLESASIAGFFGWTIPTTTQTRAMDVLISAGKLNYPWPNYDWYWEKSNGGGCLTWRPSQGLHSTFGCGGYYVLPVRIFS